MRSQILRRLIASSLFAITITWPTTTAVAESPFPMGMNLAGIADWSSEIVFVDSFKVSRPWIEQREKSAFGKGGPIPMKNGWPAKLEPAQFAETLIYVDFQPHYPGGKYVCSFEGNGKLEFSNAAQGRPAGRKQYEVDVDSSKSFIALRVRETDPKDPIRNIRLENVEIKKKAAAAGSTPFDPSFFKRYKGFNVIRFMDWQKTNNSKQQKWADRPKMDDPTQAGPKGIALEYCIELANKLDADPWLCIPHLADDDYVRNFAKLVKDKLKTNRKVYVEYSNETWNTIFEQSKYCREKGLAAGLSKNPYEAQLRYSVDQSIRIFKIFEEVFGGKDRLVRVLAAHGAHLWTGTTAMDWNEAYKNTDAIAIAPYFGNAYGDPKNAAKTAEMSVDQLLDGCTEMIAANRKKNEEYAAEAKKRGLKLMAYETGQHLVGYGGAENNPKLMELFHNANRHPRMKDLYLEDMKNWYEVGGSTFCVFSSMGKYTKWGSWGVMEWHDQKEEDAPKMLALREWMKQKK
jgi:hypothetical protein